MSNIVDKTIARFPAPAAAVRSHTSFDGVFAFSMPVLAAILCWNQPAWFLMWAMAFGIGFGLKWLMWRDALLHQATRSAARTFLWFFVWPGMDGRAFLNSANRPRRPPISEWIAGGACAAAGISLVWLLAPALLSEHPQIAAYACIAGVIFLLHFGLIRLLSNLLRTCGLDAQPIMRAPICAVSLDDFWSRRWNTAFTVSARRLLLRPLARRYGAPLAVGVVFFVSGLIHDLVLSVPARGGFGLPTLYFLVQAGGIGIERSRLGRRWGLGQGIHGRLFAILFLVAPLFWLFHPPFLRAVVTPFLAGIHN